MSDSFTGNEVDTNDSNDTIFQPKYTISKEIADQLEQIERTAWLIHNMLIMPKHESWIRRRVAIRRAAATTRIEGASMTDDEVGKLSRKGPGSRVTEDEQANINALAAYQLIDDLSAEPDLPISELIIRQLNREYLRDLADAFMSGRYRDGQNTVGKFTPPNQGDVPQLMREFSNWLQEPDETNPVVRAAIAHIQIVAIHPFWDGNGRVARGIATLIMQRSDQHFKNLLSLEAFIYGIRDDYFTAIERTLGSTFSREYDATTWIEFFAEALAIHVTQLQAELTDWHRSMQRVYAALTSTDVTQRQAEAVIFAMHDGRLTRADYVEITGVSDVTATRDLGQLVKKNWLVAHGAGRGRYYTPEVPNESDTPPEQIRLFADEEGGT